MSGFCGKNELSRMFSDASRVEEFFILLDFCRHGALQDVLRPER